MTRLRVKQNETGESQSGGGGRGVDSVLAVPGGAGGGSPARTSMAPPGPPCLSAPLGRKTGGGERCGESSGKVPGRPYNVLYSVHLSGEEEEHVHLTHDPFSRKQTPRTCAHTHTHMQTALHPKGRRACPLLTQTNKAETDLAPGKRDGAWKLRQNNADGWPLEGLGLSEGQ